ncbi:GGDEF domain-containing protein [Oryzifoliimicrobium ureilyticus]|uniref:GGDEF domain-containing protein n=1 Tax=Oryzifoliimicrobium ureilyticus TaxID=3113724 RepID=UPI003075F386
MRFISMLNPFTFVGAEVSSSRQTEDALAELYNSRPHVAATLGICLSAFSAGSFGAVQVAIYAALLVVISLLFRVFIEALFKRRKKGPLSHRWTQLFVAGSALSGASWGLSGALILYQGSPTTQTVIVAAICAIVQGSAARAYMIPGTAIINIVLVIGLMCVAAFASGNHVLILGGVVYLWFLISFIRLMVKNRLKQLRAEQLAVELLDEITKKNQQLNLANEKLAATAFEDPLTGLANRRKFTLVLEDTLREARENGSFVTVMLIDVDHFKNFNDTYGHQAGDLCLQAIAGSIASALTDGTVARYGGEEFVALIPNCDAGHGSHLAECARLAVQLTELQSLPCSPPRQTISIGLTSCKVGPEDAGEELLSAADAALYEAKRQGRNRVCVQSGTIQLLAGNRGL